MGTYVIRLRVPTIPSNLGWVMSQFPDYGWSPAVTISDSRVGTVGQTPGWFTSGLGSFPTDSWQVLIGTWTQGGECQTFLQGTSGNSRICRNGAGTDSNEKLIIGGRGESDSNHNPGAIDISDVLVFNRALNTDEINFITSTLSATPTTTISTTEPTTTVTPTTTNTPTTTITPTQKCAIPKCGCNLQGQPWCDDSNAWMASSWCHESSSKCGACFGVWCGTSRRLLRGQ